MIIGLKTLSSRWPCIPPAVTAASLPITWQHTMVMASHCVGFTLPGMMLLPGSFAGRLARAHIKWGTQGQDKKKKKNGHGNNMRTHTAEREDVCVCVKERGNGKPKQVVKSNGRTNYTHTHTYTHAHTRTNYTHTHALDLAKAAAWARAEEADVIGDLHDGNSRILHLRRQHNEWIVRWCVCVCTCVCQKRSEIAISVFFGGGGRRERRREERR